MNETLALPHEFYILGIIAIASNGLTMMVSLSQALFFHSQRKVQSDEFMKSMACRIKAIFAALFISDVFALISGIGVAMTFSFSTWYLVYGMTVLAKIAYLGAALWLRLFYNVKHGE